MRRVVNIDLTLERQSLMGYFNLNQELYHRIQLIYRILLCPVLEAATPAQTGALHVDSLTQRAKLSFLIPRKLAENAELAIANKT